MATTVSLKGLAMVCQLFQTPHGDAGICTQMQLRVDEGREHPWGRAAIGQDIPVKCAYPEDLADRLGIPLCIDRGARLMLSRTDQITETKERAIFNGCEFSRHEIQLACGRLADEARVLNAAVKTLNDAFTMQSEVDAKLSAENVAALAANAKHTASQIEALSAHLASVFVTHLARRPRP